MHPFPPPGATARPSRTPPACFARSGQAAAIAVLLACLPATWPAKAADGAGDSALAEQVHEAVNSYRASQQLPALRLSAELAQLAAEHSQTLSARRQLTHAGFQARFERARRQTCVENLAAGFTRPEPMLAGWRQSADHHRNLLDARVQEVGVASVAGHVTWLACSAR